MTVLERIEAHHRRFLSRKALHEQRLARLATERDRLNLGVFVLLGASVAAAELSAFGLVNAGGSCLCFLAACAVRVQWRRAYRETFAEHDDYIAFMRAQLGEATP